MLRRTLAALVLTLWAAPAHAGVCRVLEADFLPTEDLQIVIWLENSRGELVDTLYITEATGRYGLGNRPGIMEFNTEFGWPYGRRETVFPVWSHRRGVTYPKLVFQDTLDRDLSHEFNKSSPESYYCRPLRTDEPVRQRSVDTGTCATVAYTDKGKFSPAPADLGGRSLYPPRSDVTYTAGTDSPDVQMFRALNDLDAVTRATPAGGQPYDHAVSLPMSLADGDYVLWIEVSKELDQNLTYRYPSPALQAYGDYGVAYRGQPSVLWKVPIVIGPSTHSAQATDYAGYGDPDGMDGMVRLPDPTIESERDGSGARRLLLTGSDGATYRLRVRTTPSQGGGPPEPPRTMEVVDTDATSAHVRFVEPAGPGGEGRVKGYDVRFSVGEPLTAEGFEAARILPMKITPAGAGTVQTVEITGLVPETHYWVGIRAQDDCLDGSTPVIVELVTPRLETPAVDACFVATAAFGSPLVKEVSLLRRFRDHFLRQQVLGEIFVESYYTFGPALAAVIRPSETLRAAARAGLEPVVHRLGNLAR